MNIRPILLSLMTALFALSAQAQSKPISPADQEARTVGASNGHALTLPSQAAPAAIVSEYLRASGHSAATVNSLRSASEGRTAKTGITHLRMSQEVAGLWVYDTYVKAAVNGRGQLVHLIENLAPAPSQGVGKAAIDERAAFRAALAAVHSGVDATAQSGKKGNTITFFAKGNVFYREPSVTRVAMPMEDGSMTTGFLVETWLSKGNLLYETLVDGKGGIVSAELRTNNDSYNVFIEDPDEASQSVVGTVGITDESPEGWLFQGAGTTANIAGNNAHAYLDTDDDNVPDTAGSAAPGNGEYLAVWDGSEDPDTEANQNVSVQNLFYLNNVMHDELYRAGFDEAAGNFQEDNFVSTPRGGSDSVNAEAQDGGGLDNANFATPRDGSNPRMQMYLWTAPVEVQVNSPADIDGPYAAASAEFGEQLGTSGITGDLKLANDGVASAGTPRTPAGTFTDGCEAFAAGFFTGKIALIDRGACTFVIKVKNAEDAGAVGVVIANNVADEGPIGMAGEDATITIPALSVSLEDGDLFKAHIAAPVEVTLRALVDLLKDASLDSDIVYHEYGHGLTWRMIGRMSGAMPGAIGEGMSDVLAVIMNDDDVVGEYSTTNPDGIRTEAYDGYTRTYGDFSATEVHFDGEIYGAIGWLMWKNFDVAGLSRDEALAYIVDGMNYTPAAPKFEDMRDGILTAIANSAALGDITAHQCLVWTAFADYGVGVGATGTVHGSNPVISETFDVPSECL